MSLPENVITTLRDETISLLRNRHRAITLPKIHADTGLEEGWLGSLLKGITRDPGVCRIQTLRAYLLAHIDVKL